MERSPQWITIPHLSDEVLVTRMNPDLAMDRDQKLRKSTGAGNLLVCGGNLSCAPMRC